jgi:ABC-type antimicrobial peptide transport system permease subunit
VGLLPDLAKRVREVATALDPNLRVDPIATMDRVYSPFPFADIGVASSLAGVMLGVLLLSGAGVYTLMAFAVVQRRREIGIRSALGAQPWALIAGLFRRVLFPVVVAAGVGAFGAALLDYYFSPVLFDFTEGGRPLPWILPAAEVFIVLLGLLVVAGPARRALRVDAVETLRDE